MSTKQKSNRLVALLAVAALGGIGALAWVALRDRTPPAAGSAVDPTTSARAASPARAPEAPVPTQPAVPTPTPPLDPATAHERAAASVRQALGSSPDRLSTTAALPPFDKEAFERNPQEYLSKVEPARCFQTAAPAKDAVPLESQVQARAELVRGADYPLWVKGVPNAPVTFTAFDGGLFKENGLPSVTVRADARGLAVARFTAPPGIDGDVNIVAGSPLAVGVQRFSLRVVETPRPPTAMQ